MKLFGNVNIMGIKEVIFITKVRIPENKQCGNVIRHFIRKSDDMWDCGYSMMDHKQMVKSLKSLAQNPKVELTFNDGAMYISIPNPKKL
jgi:urease gamma subunit